MIESLLVANRGEIARRIFRTCRALGVATVAVHSDADAPAPHVREADAAVRLPGNAPGDSYLRADLLVRAASQAGADAVHPGYGFLSENPGFARAVRDAGLVWIGPPPEAIEAMASKTRAKAVMAGAGVPLLAPIDPAGPAAALSLPVLVKAAAGGGGRGMRLVRDAAELPTELAAASAEAATAFGDGEVFVEPYLEHGRHVEVQVLADTHGTVWTLGTRDCSVQRRHQKVIEEAPAPDLDDELRATLRDAAARAARAIGYVGAGTVEFLLSAPADGRSRPYFLEMNTRLQVEHPVTELVYGLDLVAWQLRVAEGEALPERPPEPRGHAVEARLYAEDPAHDWRPQTGVLRRFEVPGAALGGVPPAGADDTPWVRLDSGVVAGDTVGAHYDPMLAKVIAWAPNRDQAVRRLAYTLHRSRIHGLVTNRDLLVGTLRHPDFRAGRLGTGFYDHHLSALTSLRSGADCGGADCGGADSGGAAPAWAGGERGGASDGASVARPADGVTGGQATGPAADRAGGARIAALVAALADAVGGDTGRTLAGRLGGWRNVPSAPQAKSYRWQPGGIDLTVRYRLRRDGLEATDYPEVRLVSATADHVVLEVSGVRRPFAVVQDDDRVEVDGAGGGAYTLRRLPRHPEPTARAAPGSLLAPMPGTVVRIARTPTVGEPVTAGQPLLWLEAMKMEHRIDAPASGVLTALHVTVGSQVEMGATLAVVTATESAPTANPPP